MAINPAVPDYELDDTIELTDPTQVQAIGNQLRTTILGLLHERAATVTEIARAVGRPKSTVAYHVEVLLGAGLVRVVRTRRVRAIEERYYGRTARMFYVGEGRSPGDSVMPLDFNDFDVAAQESQVAYEAHRLWSFIRHARISSERASEFWTEVMNLVQKFDRLPRSGDTAYGFVVGLYPIPGYPMLPEPD
ncbi:MAG TPA: helix-turn-helix domain-containing protein [Acidimicrobiia bacterium]|nr:helix-turn-helix domain-containing protein [Acidimicrobiia bacterium]